MKITIYRIQPMSLTGTRSPKEWLAHMDLGSDIYMSFFGDSSESARNRAQSFWDTESARQAKNVGTSELTPSEFVTDVKVSTPRVIGVDGRSANAGKVWVANFKTNHKARVDPNELADYLNKGYVKAGPRTQMKG